MGGQGIAARRPHNDHGASAPCALEWSSGSAVLSTTVAAVAGSSILSMPRNGHPQAIVPAAQHILADSGMRAGAARVEHSTRNARAKRIIAWTLHADGWVSSP